MKEDYAKNAHTAHDGTIYGSVVVNNATTCERLEEKDDLTRVVVNLINRRKT